MSDLDDLAASMALGKLADELKAPKQREAPQQKTSGLGTFFREAALSSPATIAGLGAGEAATAAAAPLGLAAPFVGLAAGGATALGVSYLGDKGMDELEQSHPIAKDIMKTLGIDSATRAAGRKEHEYAALAGQLASAGPFISPLAKNLGQRAMSGGIQAGVGAGMRAATGEEQDWKKSAMEFAGGAALPGQLSKLGQKIPGVRPPEPAVGSRLVETAFKGEDGEVWGSGAKHDENFKKDPTVIAGFKDAQGNFLDRKQALERAKQTGQIPKDHKLEFPDEGLHSGDLRAAGDEAFKIKEEPTKTREEIRQEALDNYNKTLEDINKRAQSGEISAKAAVELQRNAKDNLKNSIPLPHIENKARPTFDEFKQIFEFETSFTSALQTITREKLGSPAQQWLAGKLDSLLSGRKIDFSIDESLKDHIGTYKKVGDKESVVVGKHEPAVSGLTTVLHEGVHAVTSALLHDAKHPLTIQMESLYQHALSITPDKTLPYFTDVHEFVSEALTSSKFQSWLSKQAPVENLPPAKNVWEQFKNFIKSALGVKDTQVESLLDQVLDHSAVLMEHGKPTPSGTVVHPRTVETTESKFGVPAKGLSLDKAFYTLNKFKEAFNSMFAKALRAAEKDKFTLEDKDAWRRYSEDPHNVKLTDKQMAGYKEYIEKNETYRKELIAYLNEKGIIPPVELAQEITGENVARMTQKQKTGMWDKLKQAVGVMEGSPFDPSVTSTPGGAKERGLFVWERNGRRMVVQIKDNRVITWEKGADLSKLGPLTPEAQKQLESTSSLQAKLFAKRGYTKDGKLVDWVVSREGKTQNVDRLRAGDEFMGGTIKEAKLEELEANTPYKYYPDYQAVLMHRVGELENFARSHKFIENWTASEEFKKVGLKPENPLDIPAGWKQPEQIDRLPMLNGYVFEPRTREIIEDFAKVNDPNAIQWLTTALVKNMMLNPLPHIANEFAHWLIARGVTGWLNPARLNTFGKTFAEASKSVLSQDQFYRDLMKNGASMLSGDARNASKIEQHLYDTALERYSKGQTFKDFAKAAGMKPFEMYNAISKASNKIMWTVRDTMYVQLIKEKMSKGMDMQKAIADTERHMPTYQLPSRIGEPVLGATLSRGMSKFLQNPNLVIFSRYHHGMVSSLMNTVQEAVGRGPEGAKGIGKGMDSLAAYAFGLAVFYPLADWIAKQMFGPTAEQRRAGPFHPIQAGYDVATGKKDAMSFINSFFTFNPVMLDAGQLLFNRQLYNGQPVYKEGSAAHDLGQYAMKQVPQVSTTMRVTDPKTGGGLNQWLASQLDIKAPSQARVALDEKYMEKAKKAAERRRLGLERK